MLRSRCLVAAPNNGDASASMLTSLLADTTELQLLTAGRLRLTVGSYLRLIIGSQTNRLLN
jgi:hypothetical protein